MSDFGPASDRIVPIQIRPDVTVNIQDIPYDLTMAEAEKIAAVIQAYAQTGDRIGEQGEAKAA